ncbi:hypothetical protein SY2F82_77920 [Streptomyces sp. Y2F8-2]|nr:hypothetical protein SY2F82_77920 [Streptomyces sp. Y2F8-2]
MVNDPLGLTHVVDVSVRSDSAPTRLADNRAATRADDRSAACVAQCFAALAAATPDWGGVGWGAAKAVSLPSRSEMETAKASEPAMGAATIRKSPRRHLDDRGKNADAHSISL